MEDILLSEAIRRNKKRKRRRNWHKVVTVMAAIVVFCTTYALILPALTMENDPICGQEVHEHTDECYKKEAVSCVCPYAALDGTDSDGSLILHSHSEICYDELGNLRCPLQEIGEHIHGEGCSTTEQILVCEEEELEAHTHSEEECYGDVETLICTLEECPAHAHEESCYSQTDVLLCTEIEAEAHTHGEGCYTQTDVLVCTQAETEGHAHGEQCYNEANELICTVPETEAHSHSESCYALQDALSCELQESAGHVHTEDCYGKEQQLSCTLPEGEGHTHSDMCWTVEYGLTCEKQEGEGHTHTETCYEEQTIIFCTVPQVGEHTHTEECGSECVIIPGVYHAHDESCFATVELEEPELICEIPEHVHVDECYPKKLPPDEGYLCDIGAHKHEETCYDETGKLTCNIVEHIHEVTCKVENYDPEADLEAPEDWESTMIGIKLTGNWPKDVLAIAESQLGYRESDKNVIMLEDGSIKGYTRYGAWYGIPYGDWCAMFVSFCLDYAEIDTVPQDCGCGNYVLKLKEEDMYRLATEYIPKPGDIVFFDWEYEDPSQIAEEHIGLVAEVIRDENGNPIEIKTIEGNSGDRVQYVTYDYGDPVIVSYGELPPGKPLEPVCGMDDHTHGEGCYDGEGNLTCLVQEHTHDASCMGRKLFYTDDTMRVQVTIVGAAELPGNLVLDVKPITPENAPDAHGTMQVALSQKVATDTKFVSQASFFDMKLYSDGGVYELPEGATAKVTVTFSKPVFAADDIAGAVDIHTYILSTEETAPSGESGSDAQTPADDSSEFVVSDEVVSEDAMYGQSTEDNGLPEIPYTAGIADAESYLNVDQGITEVTFETTNMEAFALALSDTTQTGDFWVRVKSLDEITADGTYMIVSAQGNYALTGNTSTNYTAVTVQTVKGNTQYYTISNSGSTSVRWTFTPSGNGFVIKNQASSVYVAPYRQRSWYTYTYYALNTSSKVMTLSYHTPENCWRMTEGTYYLNNEGTGSFTCTSSNDGSYNSSNPYYYTRDMLIFKLSDVTSLTIPGDVISAGGGGAAEGIAPDKPDYGDFINPSGSKTGDTAVVQDGDGEEAIAVNGKYYSDPATSNIERNFRKNSYEENKPNDGKVMTDKSVIYKGDDYNAFSSYEDNTFGVTLSALGQAYEMPQEDMVVTPVDVVFVLDVSGSMTKNGTDDGTDASRAQQMAAAVNDSMYHILQEHEANRVGVVVYSSGAWEVLPLGRYTADNNEYFVCEPESFSHNPTGFSMTVHKVYGSSSLKSEDGTSYAGAGRSAGQGIGTYTQAGIAMGHKVFQDIGSDTTYTAVIGEGEDARYYIVPRQPVYILLSDGEPTHSTNIYMDVLNGPHYGDGTGEAENAKGIKGYYTILSANYYKRMTGIQYNRPALFYTIGMGIKTPEEGDTPLTGSDTGDNYKRAILNPTVANITGLTSTINPTQTTTMLKNLMLSNYSGQAVDVTCYWLEPWMGIPHTYVPVLQGNPYANNYSYADNAFFGSLPEDKLKEIFQKILEESLKASPYGFVLYENSSVEILDNIGEGMEIKGVPVLRYGGVNYTNPKISSTPSSTFYVYSGIVTDPYIPDRIVDLSQISVVVTRNPDGTQSIRLYIPDTVLPIYTPEQVGREFYYESLPVRLIYQVGLTEKAEQQVLELNETGGELTFYTNKWDNTKHAVSTLLPSHANPFYYDVDGDGTPPPYQPHHDLKTQNTTDTVDYSVDCDKDRTSMDGNELTKVLHKLGNNGKLVFKADPPKKVEIPVEKVWDEGVVLDDDVSIEVSLYHVQPTETGSEVVTLISTLVLNDANDWKGIFTDLPQLEDGYYVIAENELNDFHAQYSGDTKHLVINNKPVLVAVVDMSDIYAVPTVIITNILKVELPETGGPGVIHFYLAGGLLIMAAAMLYFTSRMSLRRRKGR